MHFDGHEILLRLLVGVSCFTWTRSQSVVSQKSSKAISTRLMRPEFIGNVPNVTVAVGRDAVLPCLVRNLQDFQVAFVHLDRQMIVAIHDRVITRIPRFHFSHDNHHTWNLHIQNVQKEDNGHYMCQINTDPMLANVGYLNVVVPPNIVDAESSASSVSVRETHNATLVCKAEGVPVPRIKWQREDKRPIIVKRSKADHNQERLTRHGSTLQLMRVSRTEMGAYLCIAQNGVPPSVSKRIILNVEFSPLIWVPNQLVGAPLGSNVSLECHTESSPRAIAYWNFKDRMILKSDRFHTEERHHSGYKLDSLLTIRNVRQSDYGSYRSFLLEKNNQICKCLSENSLGEMDGTIMLYELERVTSNNIVEKKKEEKLDENNYRKNGSDDETEDDGEEDADVHDARGDGHGSRDSRRRTERKRQQRRNREQLKKQRSWEQAMVDPVSDNSGRRMQNEMLVVTVLLLHPILFNVPQVFVGVGT